MKIISQTDKDFDQIIESTLKKRCGEIDNKVEGAVRKSIYAVKNIKTGEKLSQYNICIKGPGGGILPKYYELLINRRAKKNIDRDHPIQWSDI